MSLLTCMYLYMIYVCTYIYIYTCIAGAMHFLLSAMWRVWYQKSTPIVCMTVDLLANVVNL